MNDCKKLLYDLFKSGKIKTAKKMPENSTVVCSAIADRDYREINMHWELEGNIRNSIIVKISRKLIVYAINGIIKTGKIRTIISKSNLICSVGYASSRYSYP